MSEETQGELEEGEQIRWQFQVPDSGTYFTLEVDEGEIAFYASTKITSPNEAFYEWMIQTPFNTTVFIRPGTVENQNAETMNTTFTTIYTALFGLTPNNTFTLSSTDTPPATEEVTTLSTTEGVTTTFATTTQEDESTTGPPTGRLFDWNHCMECNQCNQGPFFPL